MAAAIAKTNSKYVLPKTQQKKKSQKEMWVVASMFWDFLLLTLLVATCSCCQLPL